jgi:hypothetical protein
MRSEFEKYVTVLDFTNGDVMTYPINVFDMESEELETAITNMGHNLSNCEWMVHDELPIIH